MKHVILTGESVKASRGAKDSVAVAPLVLQEHMFSNIHSVAMFPL
ncbi:MAG TPA: hypothetical protein VE467_02325 [Chryseolinea sp.]|nr:hypothetical protein [Chryseolinea sp.]